MPDHFSEGVTLEVRIHRFAGGVNLGGEAGKNPRVRTAKMVLVSPRGRGKGPKKFLKGSALVKP